MKIKNLVFLSTLIIAHFILVAPAQAGIIGILKQIPRIVRSEPTERDPGEVTSPVTPTEILLHTGSKVTENYETHHEPGIGGNTSILDDDLEVSPSEEPASIVDIYDE